MLGQWAVWPLGRSFLCNIGLGLTVGLDYLSQTSRLRRVPLEQSSRICNVYPKIEKHRWHSALSASRPIKQPAAPCPINLTRVTAQHDVRILLCSNTHQPNETSPALHLHIPDSIDLHPQVRYQRHTCSAVLIGRIAFMCFTTFLCCVRLSAFHTIASPQLLVRGE